MKIAEIAGPCLVYGGLATGLSKSAAMQVACAPPKRVEGARSVLFGISKGCCEQLGLGSCPHTRALQSEVAACLDGMVDVSGGQAEPGGEVAEAGSAGLRQIGKANHLDAIFQVGAVPALRRAETVCVRWRKGAPPSDRLFLPLLQLSGEGVIGMILRSIDRVAGNRLDEACAAGPARVISWSGAADLFGIDNDHP